MSILVLEADPADIDLLGLALEDIEDLEWATTAGEAQAILADRLFDVLVMDLHSGPPDGLTICRELREAGRREMIMLLSATLTSPEGRAEVFRAGADDFVAKPFHDEELRARVGALRRRAPTRPPVLILGDLSINLRDQTVRHGHRDIALTRRELDLLLFLATPPRTLRSRREILDAVWSESKAESSTVLDVYLRRLRHKLDQPARPETIITLRGAGYLLDPC